MSLVRGENVVGYFFENGHWYPAVCSRSMSIQVNVDTVDTTTTGSGIWRTIVPTKNSWSFTREGLVSLNVPGGLTIADIESRMRAHTEMLLRFQATADDGTVYTDEGYCYITGATKVSSFDNVVTWNVDGTGNGKLTQVFTPIVQPIPIMYRYEYEATGGETGFTANGSGGFPDLRNKQIINATKDGVANGKLVTGAPGSKELKYVAATGEFQWASTFEPGEIAVVNYQNL